MLPQKPYAYRQRILLRGYTVTVRYNSNSVTNSIIVYSSTRVMVTKRAERYCTQHIMPEPICKLPCSHFVVFFFFFLARCDGRLFFYTTLIAGTIFNILLLLCYAGEAKNPTRYYLSTWPQKFIAAFFCAQNRPKEIDN